MREREPRGMRPGKLGIELAVMGAVVLALTLLGPFGSYALPLGRRLLDWTLFVYGGYALYRPVIWAGRVVAAHSGIPGAVCIALACVIAAMPTTLLVAWLIDARGLGAATLAGLAERYVQVLVVGAVATLVQLALAPAGVVDAVGHAEPAAVPPPMPPGQEPASTPDAVVGPRLAARLPVSLAAAPILALSHEDHYVRVHHAGGSTLLLMRISDAIGELDGIAGARVHRSWWVAREAVAGCERRGRAVWLRLSNGLEAPVARTMVTPLREAGWF